MSSVNQVFLLGNVGRDAETRYSADGAAVTNFSLATSRRWKDKATGDIKEATEWSRCCCFGRIAEVAGEYLKKGSKCHVQGQLRTREWEKDGVKHYTTEIVVEQLTLISKAERAAEPTSPMTQRAQKRDGGTIADMDDDVPF